MFIIKSNFQKEDIHKLAELVLNAWPHLFKKFPGKYAIRFSYAYIDYCNSISAWKKFTFNKEQLIACIFCQAGINNSISLRFKLFRLAFKYLFLWLIGYFGRYGAFGGFIKANSQKNNLIQKELKKGSYEIGLFLVHSKFRNRGLGKELLNYLIKDVEESGFDEIVLSTDEISNWMFYEKTGFYKSFECFDPVSSYLDGLEQRIFVYRRNLNENRKNI